MSANSVLLKQQNTLPTSMRYERVQEILQSEPALKPMISARNQAIDSRFGEKMLFSKEVIQVTQAIHAEGKDAHKLPKNEVLKFALRVLRVVPGSSVRIAPAEPSEKKDAKAQARQTKGKTTARVEPSSLPKPARSIKPKSPSEDKPQAKDKSSDESSNSHTPAPEAALPESELPPDRQPLRLPAGFDPKKYPHYDVQSSVYSMLLSALTLSLHFEKFPEKEERQGLLETLVSKYCLTCNQIDPSANG